MSKNATRDRLLLVIRQLGPIETRDLYDETSYCHTGMVVALRRLEADGLIVWERGLGRRPGVVRAAPCGLCRMS